MQLTYIQPCGACSGLFIPLSTWSLRTAGGGALCTIFFTLLTCQLCLEVPSCSWLPFQGFARSYSHTWTAAKHWPLQRWWCAKRKCTFTPVPSLGARQSRRVRPRFLFSSKPWSPRDRLSHACIVWFHCTSPSKRNHDFIHRVMPLWHNLWAFLSGCIQPWPHLPKRVLLLFIWTSATFPCYLRLYSWLLTVTFWSISEEKQISGSTEVTLCVVLYQAYPHCRCSRFLSCLLPSFHLAFTLIFIISWKVLIPTVLVLCFHSFVLQLHVCIAQ